jgi:hypothetical protein
MREIAELRRPLTPGFALDPAERRAIAIRVREGKRQQSDDPRTVRIADVCTPTPGRDLHRPATPEARCPAILELLRQGLKARDIAAAMRIDLGEVLEVERAWQSRA